MYLYRNIFSIILDMHVCIAGCMRCWCHMTSPQELRIGLLDPSRGVEAPSLQWKMKVYQVVPKKKWQKMVVMWWWWIWMGETSHSIYSMCWYTIKLWPHPPATIMSASRSEGLRTCWVRHYEGREPCGQAFAHRQNPVITSVKEIGKAWRWHIPKLGSWICTPINSTHTHKQRSPT